MILGEPVDVVLQGVDAGSGEIRLAHRAAEHAPEAHQRRHAVAPPGEHRAPRPAEALGDRDRDQVERRRKRSRVLAARDRGVQQAGAV